MTALIIERTWGARRERALPVVSVITTFSSSSTGAAQSTPSTTATGGPATVLTGRVLHPSVAGPRSLIQVCKVPRNSGRILPCIIAKPFLSSFFHPHSRHTVQERCDLSAFQNVMRDRYVRGTSWNLRSTIYEGTNRDGSFPWCRSRRRRQESLDSLSCLKLQRIHRL